MNNDGNVQDAQVVEKQTVALDAFKKSITDAREDFRKQLANVKDAIELREEEIKTLTLKKNKLQGAIEASDLYLNPKSTIVSR